MSEAELVKKVNKMDEGRWLTEISSKASLGLFKQFKKEIKQEMIYDNTFESTLLFQARSNTLRLRWRRRFIDGDVDCKICGNGNEETLVHFLTECEALKQIYDNFEMGEKRMDEILQFTEGIELSKSKMFLGLLWQKRKNLLRELGN